MPMCRSPPFFVLKRRQKRNGGNKMPKEYYGCIIFSVGERKNSLPTLNFCKKIGTHIKSHV